VVPGVRRRTLPAEVPLSEVVLPEVVLLPIAEENLLERASSRSLLVAALVEFPRPECKRRQFLTIPGSLITSMIA